MFLHSVHTMLCVLHTYYPWSLDLFIHVPFQPPFSEHTAIAAISSLGTSRTHCHLCPNMYSLTPESSELYESEVPCPTTQHRNNIPILREEKHDISLKILHQAGFETARQAGTLAKFRALSIAPRPSLKETPWSGVLIDQWFKILCDTLLSYISRGLETYKSLNNTKIKISHSTYM